MEAIAIAVLISGMFIASSLDKKEGENIIAVIILRVLLIRFFYLVF